MKNLNKWFVSSKVRDTNTFWAWTQKYLVPAVYDVKWYNGQPFEYKEGFMSDMSGYLVGMPRFRQLRVKQGRKYSCIIIMENQRTFYNSVETYFKIN